MRTFVLLAVTVNGQHVPNSPFLLHINNCVYYRSNFKQPVQTIDIIRGPLYIAFSSNGDLFVTSSYTNSIHVYNKNGRKQAEISRRGKGNREFDFPYGIAVKGKDEFFVADCYVQPEGSKFSTHGKFLGIFGSLGSGDGELGFVQGLTTGPHGMVYVSDMVNNRIGVLSETGVFIRNVDVSASISSSGSRGGSMGSMEPPIFARIPYS